MRNCLVILESKSGPINLSADTVKALQVRFPTRNVTDELLKAHLWLERYPKRRPVSIWRFLDNWHDKAPATVRPPTVVHAWWATPERTVQQGFALGLQARPGESLAEPEPRALVGLRVR